ncbi:hypothetical protein AVEN_130146-1 [Araneus ventricosus]|uniref:Uncharacterized protein n=1 Tax=Araneus ventricosus TaxID=182803 RepID=A0A4Y2MXE9_ARAVE|nr:hypothetical protein AVEN_130146-1 [Araneus ventricosus]
MDSKCSRGDLIRFQLISLDQNSALLSWAWCKHTVQISASLKKRGFKHRIAEFFALLLFSSTPYHKHPSYQEDLLLNNDDYAKVEGI